MDVVNGRLLITFDIDVFESQSGFVGGGNDVGSEEECEDRDERGGEEIREEQSFEGDARCLHGYDFAVVCQLRREKNHGDEDKKRGEHVEIVGQEVEVVFKYYFVKRSLVLGEFVQFLGKVKDDGNGHDEKDGKQEGSQELPHDIPV